MRQIFPLAVLAFAAPFPASAQPPDAAQIVMDTVKSPDFMKAGALLRQHFERYIDEIVLLTEIPAPPFGEASRARAFAELMRKSNIVDVEIDPIGNVVGVLPGRDRAKPPLIVAAHLDTVFAAGTDVKVKRIGTRLAAPGIGDDSRGLAALLSIARAMSGAAIVPDSDVILVGTVGEEGHGNLRGVQFLFQHHARARSAIGFITLDMSGADRIVTRHVGSRRFRIVFTGPGGHSFEKFGIVNPAVPLAKTIANLYAIPTPPAPRTSYAATIVGGGTSVNAIPSNVHVDVDIRSVSSVEIDRIERELRAITETAVREENSTRSTASGKIIVAFEQIGNRPAATIDETAGLGAMAFAASRATGNHPSFAEVSTDANVPASLGIPAIAIGTGGGGGNAHSLDEYIDIEINSNVRGLKSILATIIASTKYP